MTSEVSYAQQEKHFQMKQKWIFPCFLQLVFAFGYEE